MAPPSAWEDKIQEKRDKIPSFRTAVVVILKGSLYRNALFMIIIIIVMII